MWSWVKVLYKLDEISSGRFNLSLEQLKKVLRIFFFTSALLATSGPRVVVEPVVSL